MNFPARWTSLNRAAWSHSSNCWRQQTVTYKWVSLTIRWPDVKGDQLKSHSVTHLSYRKLLKAVLEQEVLIRPRALAERYLDLFQKNAVEALALLVQDYHSRSVIRELNGASCNPTACPSIHPSICLSTHPAVHLVVRSSICLPHPSFHPSIHLNIYPSMHLSFWLSIHPSIHWPTIFPSVHASIHLTIHSFIQSSTSIPQGNLCVFLEGWVEIPNNWISPLFWPSTTGIQPLLSCLDSEYAIIQQLALDCLGHITLDGTHCSSIYALMGKAFRSE